MYGWAVYTNFWYFLSNTYLACHDIPHSSYPGSRLRMSVKMLLLAHSSDMNIHRKISDFKGKVTFANNIDIALIYVIIDFDAIKSWYEDTNTKYPPNISETAKLCRARVTIFFYMWQKFRPTNNFVGQKFRTTKRFVQWYVCMHIYFPQLQSVYNLQNQSKQLRRRKKKRNHRERR